MSSATGVWPIIRSRLTQVASPSTTPAVARVLEAGVEEDQHQRQQQDQHHGAELRRRSGRAPDRARPSRAGSAPAGRSAGRPRGRRGSCRRYQVGSAITSADEHQQADVGAEQVAGGDRPRVRRHEGVHDREGARRRQRVGQDRAAEPRGDAEDDRQHHDQAGVEEDREAEEQRGDAEREGRAVLAEAVDQPVGQHLAPPVTSSSRPIIAPKPTSSATVASVRAEAVRAASAPRRRRECG